MSFQKDLNEKMHSIFVVFGRLVISFTTAMLMDIHNKIFLMNNNKNKILLESPLGIWSIIIDDEVRSELLSQKILSDRLCARLNRYLKHTVVHGNSKTTRMKSWRPASLLYPYGTLLRGIGLNPNESVWWPNHRLVYVYRIPNFWSNIWLQ